MEIIFQGNPLERQVVRVGCGGDLASWGQAGSIGLGMLTENQADVWIAIKSKNSESETFHLAENLAKAPRKNQSSLCKQTEIGTKTEI